MGIGVVRNSAIRSTGSAPITVGGQGGTNTSSRLHHGVALGDGGAIVSFGTGPIAVTGDAGPSLNGSYGVVIADETPQAFPARVTSTSGNVQITGTASTGNFDLAGIVIAHGGFVQTSGSGTMSLTGSSGTMSAFNSGGDNMAVFVVNGSLISEDGDVVIDATGGATSGYGVWMSGSGLIAGIGTANLTIRSDSMNLARPISFTDRLVTLIPATSEH